MTSSGQPTFVINPSSTSTWYQTFVAGWIAGGLVDFALYPLDKIKVERQLLSFKTAVSPHLLINSATTGILRNPQSGLSSLRKFYVGLTPCLLGSFPSQGLYFTVYHQSKEWIQYYQPLLMPSLQHFLAGALADLAASVIYVPSEVLKTGLVEQSLHVNRRNLWTLLSHIRRFHGLSGFYRGYKLTLLRDLPYSALKFTLYEKMKVLIEGKERSHMHLFHALSGMVAGFVSGWMTMPLDVMKTHLQVQDQKTSLYHAFHGVWLRQGFLGFFVGGTARCFSIALVEGIVFAAYEAILTLMD